MVILGSIPQVGYLTDFDSWIFNMFVMLAACVFAHQLVVNSFRKVEQWPFRAVVIRFIEMSGRVIIIPLSLAMFNSTFQGDELDVFHELYVRIPLFFGFVMLLIREAFGVRKVVNIAMDEIGEKIAKGKRNSWWELFVINLVLFKVFDLTTEPYKAKLKRMKRMAAGKNGSMDVSASMEMSGTFNKLHDNKENNNSSAGNDNPTSRPVSTSTDQNGVKPKRLSRFRSQSLYDSDDEM